jgi:hypothetical protein
MHVCVCVVCVCVVCVVCVCVCRVCRVGVWVCVTVGVSKYIYIQHQMIILSIIQTILYITHTHKPHGNTRMQ